MMQYADEVTVIYTGIIYNPPGLFSQILQTRLYIIMKLLLKLAIFPLLVVVTAVNAGETADIKELRKSLIERLPKAADADIKASPIKGLYEVLAGGQIMYMTKDARYVLDGSLFDLQERRNLTEETRGVVRKKAIEELGEDNMLVYTPKGETKHTVTIFTDIYCPYCRRLHEEMDEYMANGVKVRYVFLPFKGKQSYDTSVSVWCAKDPNKAMDKAKAGEDVESKTCDNPISQHQNLANVLGIRGTPAIMLENGYLNPGYVPVAKLVDQIKGLGL